MSRIVIFNKPFNVLTQFTDSRHAGERRATLADYIDIAGIYPAGRLDRDSEGLLVLTDDGALNHKLTHPGHQASKTYWVQVEGVPDEAAVQRLRNGVQLRDGLTRPARCEQLAPPDLWPRNPPIRVRKAIPTAWLSLTISEGRNRQVRRMCAAVGYPVLRLVRYRVASWTLDGLEPGEWLEL